MTLKVKTDKFHYIKIKNLRLIKIPLRVEEKICNRSNQNT